MSLGEVLLENGVLVAESNHLQLGVISFFAQSQQLPLPYSPSSAYHRSPLYTATPRIAPCHSHPTRAIFTIATKRVNRHATRHLVD